MVKLCSLIVAFCCFTLVGFYFSYKLSQRKQFLCEFTLFLNTAETYIRYSGNDIISVIDMSMTSEMLKPIRSYIVSNKDNFVNLWCVSLSKIPKQTGLNSQDFKLLNDFGMQFGATDKEGQISHIELYKSLFDKALSDAEQNVKTKAKLYRMLGIFGGAAFVLMVI